MQTEKAPTPSYMGFTLVEVIISLAVFGLVVGGILGLLPWGVDKAGEVKDRSTAHGLVDAVQIELERLGFSLVESGTKRLEGLYRSVGEPEDVENGSIKKLLLVAPKNGRMVSLEKVVEMPQARQNGKLVHGDATEVDSTDTDLGGKIDFNLNDARPISLAGIEESQGSEKDLSMNRWIPPDERYFAILCSQFPIRSTEDRSLVSPHFHHPSNGYLALQVEVQWPYRLPGRSEPIAERFRSKFVFPVAMVR